MEKVRSASLLLRASGCSDSLSLLAPLELRMTVVSGELPRSIVKISGIE
jgi:hypothetical protein